MRNVKAGNNQDYKVITLGMAIVLLIIFQMRSLFSNSQKDTLLAQNFQASDKETMSQHEQKLQKIELRRKRQQQNANHQGLYQIEDSIDGSYESRENTHITINIKDSLMQSIVSNEKSSIIYNSYVEQYQHMPIILDFDSKWAYNYLYEAEALKNQYFLKKVNGNSWSQIVSFYPLGFDLTDLRTLEQIGDDKIDFKILQKDQTLLGLMERLRPRYDSKQYQYKLKIKKTYNGQISFGVVTAQGKDEQDASDNEAIYYYGHLGQVLIDDKWVDLGGQIITSDMVQEHQNGLQVAIRIDMRRGIISWYLDSIQQSVCSFPSYFLGQDIYLLIQMNHEGDELQLIQPKQWAAIQKHVDYLIADVDL